VEQNLKKYIYILGIKFSFFLKNKNKNWEKNFGAWGPSPPDPYVGPPLHISEV
jgi:hypothetical protein